MLPKVVAAWGVRIVFSSEERLKQCCPGVIIIAAADAALPSVCWTARRVPHPDYLTYFLGNPVNWVPRLLVFFS